MEDREKTSDWPGSSGPKEQMVVSFLGFFLSFFFHLSYILDLQVKKPATWKCQEAQTKGAKQNPALYNQRTRKEVA